LWNAATGKVMATFEEKGRSYRASRGSLAISADGKRIAAVGMRQDAPNDFRYLIDLWDVTTGEITNTLIGEPGPILFATFSPDGASLAIGRIKGLVEIWNALNGNQIAKFETNSQSIAYTPDGKVLMTGGADIAFWDAASGKRLAHVEPIDDVKWLDSLCLSADARVLAASGIREIGGTNRIYLWDIVYPADGPLTVNARYRGKLVGHSDHIYTLAFSPDGRKLASGSGDTKVRIWDVPSEREELCLHDHADFVYCVAFSPDGENLATIGRDSLKFWELTALLQSAQR
jgi:WD40 repeat protein